jgi:hypothetical protein
MTQKNGFQTHGIAHLSPSSINAYMNCPAFWLTEKVFKKRGTPGAAMWRGIVVEDACSDVLLHGKTRDEAVEAALAAYDKKTAMIFSDHSKQRNGIPGFVDQALEGLEQYGKDIIAPPADDSGRTPQHKISLSCGLDDGTSIDFIGYLDFAFGGNRKTIVDLKTSFACPSKQSFAHIVQRCVYQKAAADGWSVEFLYATPKKHASLADGDPEDVLAMVKAVANRMNRFLKLSADKHELAQIVPVIPDTFYWSDPGMKAERRKLFGI